MSHCRVAILAVCLSHVAAGRSRAANPPPPPPPLDDWTTAQVETFVTKILGPAFNSSAFSLSGVDGGALHELWKRGVRDANPQPSDLEGGAQHNLS